MAGKLGITLAICAVVAAFAGGTATGAPPSQFRTYFDGDRVAGGVTQRCGFTVRRHDFGTIDVRLFYNSSGLVAREQVVAIDFRTTFYNPANGKSHTFVVSGTTTYDYGAGAQLGSSVVVTTTGSLENYPEQPANAGQIVEDGTVVDFNGAIPVVAVDGEVSRVGSWGNAARGPLCAALA